MRDTPSSNRDPKLRTYRQTDWWSRIRRDCDGADRLLVRGVPRGVKGRRQPGAATQALRWPVAAGSDVIRFLRPERAEVEIIISNRFRLIGIFTARVLLERTEDCDTSTNIRCNTCKSLRTLEAGGLCRGRPPHHIAAVIVTCVADGVIVSGVWERVTVNWSWSDMVTSARHVPRDCGVRRTSAEGEFRLGHFDRLIIVWFKIRSLT